MTGTSFSDVHPHGYRNWVNTHFRFKIKPIKISLGNFAFGLVIIYLAYVLALLIGSIAVCLNAVFG